MDNMYVNLMITYPAGAWCVNLKESQNVCTSCEEKKTFILYKKRPFIFLGFLEKPFFIFSHSCVENNSFFIEVAHEGPFIKGYNEGTLNIADF